MMAAKSGHSGQLPSNEACTSATATSPHAPYVHWLIESRPPSLTWSRPAPPQSNQPTLDFVDHEGDSAEAAAPPHDRSVRLSTAKARWARGLDQACRMPRCGAPGWRWLSSRRCWTSVRLLRPFIPKVAQNLCNYMR